MNATLLVFNLGGPEIILIVLVVLLLFGGKKIPELMKGLGRGVREFNSAKANIESEIKENIREIEEPKKEAILQKENKSPVERY